jgi:hypothetical protein
MIRASLPGGWSGAAPTAHAPHAPQERPRALRTPNGPSRGVRGRYRATSCVWRGVWPGARCDGRTGNVSEAPRAQEGTG